MSVLSELFGSEIGKKQDREVAKQVVITIGELLEKGKDKKTLVNAINAVMTNWAKDKENKQLLKYIYEDLLDFFPKIHEKYHFLNPISD